jgi:N-methylhydantoinase B
MRFSDTGYYIERYLKCDNCGILIYKDPIKVAIAEGDKLYCSDWCQQWAAQRASGAAIPRLPLPRTKARV